MRKIDGTNIVLHNESANGLAESAGNFLTDILRRTASEPTLLLLSGGSSLSVLQSVPDETLGPFLTVSTFDERWSEEPRDSNFQALLNLPFYKRGEGRGVAFINTATGKGETLLQNARRVEDSIINFQKDNPNHKLVIVIGIGEDGHLGGMMPYPDNQAHFASLFLDSAHKVIGYKTDGVGAFAARITGTATLLALADKVMAFVSGEKKRPAVERLLAPEGNSAETPARLLRTLRMVNLFTDTL